MNWQDEIGLLDLSISATQPYPCGMGCTGGGSKT